MKTNEVGSLTLALVLDRSGSMQTNWEETIQSVDTMVAEQVELGPTLVARTFFNDRVDVRETLLGATEGIIPEDVSPSGMTALYDAVARGILQVERVHEQIKTDKVVFVIATDGMENASHDYNLKSISKLISDKRELGWEFIFIGANQDAWATGASLNTSTSFQWDSHTAGATTHTYSLAGNQIGSYRTTSSGDAPLTSGTFTEVQSDSK